jgi:hypothetical protein
MSVEEKHLDVLQNMEFAIVQIYRSTSDLIDAEVLNAIESLIRTYNLEVKGGFAASPKVKGISATVAEAVTEVCELRLGRTSAENKWIQPTAEITEAKTVQNIIDCLKRIQSSIKFWTKKEGRQGYLNYINKFIQ